MDHDLGTRIRAHGLRATRPRLAVLAVLEEAQAEHQHLLVSQVSDLARDRAGDMSTQAVYDCLDALTRTGLARRIEPAGSPARFEARVGDNHHHLVCRSCGVASDVDCAVGETGCLEPSDPQGFTIEEAEVTYWGLCPTCQEQTVRETKGAT